MRGSNGTNCSKGADEIIVRSSSGEIRLAEGDKSFDNGSDRQIVGDRGIFSPKAPSISEIHH